MKWLTLGVAVVALILGAYGTAATISQRSQVTSLRTQIARERTQIAHDGRLITAQQAQLAGQHRDLITCADLQHLQMSGADSAGDQVTVGYDNGGGANAVTLPSHCINH